MSLIAACFGGPVLRRVIAGWWDGYKDRHAHDPVDMKLRRGIWRPAGLIRNVDRATDWVAYLGMVGILLGIIGAVYGAMK
jgi:hypothetical protein